MTQLDENKLHEFVDKMLGDLGGALSVPGVRLGVRLGLFDALKGEVLRLGREQGGRGASPSATSANGLWPRRPTAMSATTRRPRRSACRLNRPWSSW